MSVFLSRGALDMNKPKPQTSPNGSRLPRCLASKRLEQFSRVAPEPRWVMTGSHPGGWFSGTVPAESATF